MKVYRFLSNFAPVRKKYASKFFLVASPLLLLILTEICIIYLAGNRVLTTSLKIIAIILFLLTILAVWGIMKMFNNLVTPLYLAQEALDKYVTTNEIPQLPIEYEDEAGMLMNNIQSTLTQLDTLLVEKSDMIDLLSHDLRSPVGRIMSISNLLKIDDETDKNIYADYITNESKGLLRMLENILLMLKEDSHAFHLDNVNLKHLVQETASFFDFAIAEKKLELIITIDESLTIYVQPDLFRQAVRNIIGNAIKFSPDGKAIRITGKQEMDKISLSIQDEGLGFKPGDINKIFDRFTVAGKKGTHGETSTGLGLYLSKKIVEKHGGKLMADSKGLNHGASFTIILQRLITKKPQDMASKHKSKLVAIPSKRVYKPGVQAAF
jgi:signal transduction histidine kinase